MPHKPGHGTQRRRIERQSRGQTAQPISRASQKASTQALVDAESRRLQDFIDQNYNEGKQEDSTTQMIVEDMPEKFKKRFYDDKGNYIGPQNAADMVFVDFYDDGRNKYQRTLNRFLNESPETRAAYNKRFPITSALQRGLPALFGLAGGPAMTIGSNILSGGKQLGGMLKEEFGPMIEGLKSLVTDIDLGGKPKEETATGSQNVVKTDMISPVAQSRIDEQNIFTGELPKDPSPIDFPSQFTGATPTGPETPFRFQGPLVVNPSDMMIPEATRRVEDVLPTDPITLGLKSLFTGETPTNRNFSGTLQQSFNPPMIPGGMPRGTVQSARLDPLLGSSPNIAYGQEMNMLDVLAAQRARRGFNEGGVVSINNPQYNMLMNASDFDI